MDKRFEDMRINSHEHAARRSHEAWILAGKPDHYQFDHRTGKGRIIKDSKRAHYRRLLNQHRRETGEIE